MTREEASDRAWMRRALTLARGAARSSEVPVGAVVVSGGRLVGRGFNRREGLKDPTHHAEIAAIRSAARKIGSWRLTGCTLYVTLEPCAMCAGACVNARLDRVVYGCADPKAGFVRTLGSIADDRRLNHRCRITPGVLENECAGLLTQFFRAKRS